MNTFKVNFMVDDMPISLPSNLILKDVFRQIEKTYNLNGVLKAATADGFDFNDLLYKIKSVKVEVDEDLIGIYFNETEMINPTSFFDCNTKKLRDLGEDLK